MSNTIISPNMGLPVPVPGTDPGPDWANNIVADMSIIDAHNHSPGQGVPITPSGMSITSDLPMGGNNLTATKSVRFTSQVSPLSASSDIGCLYESGVDLYYNDGAGNQVRVTQSGSVTGATGTITGLPSGTASASFSGGTFTFQSATNTPATMNVGPIITGSATASPKTVTISASASQPSNYNLTLPLALPPTYTSALMSDTSGNASFIPLAAGTYSPTVSSGGNGTLQAAVAGSFTYMRINNQVLVNGRISGTADSGGALSWSISLPVSSNATVNGVNGSIAPNGGVGLVSNRIIYGGSTSAYGLLEVNDTLGAAIVANVCFTYTAA